MCARKARIQNEIRARKIDYLICSHLEEKKGGHRPRPVKSSDRTIFVKHFQKHSKIHLFGAETKKWIFGTKTTNFCRKKYNPQTPI